MEIVYFDQGLEMYSIFNFACILALVKEWVHQNYIKCRPLSFIDPEYCLNSFLKSVRFGLRYKIANKLIGQGIQNNIKVHAFCDQKNNNERAKTCLSNQFLSLKFHLH